MHRFASISTTTLVCCLLGSGCDTTGGLHTAPVFLSQPDAQALSCLMANVSEVNVFNIRIDIVAIGGDVIASHAQDVLLAGETAAQSANTIDPFVPTGTLRCSFYFDGPQHRVRATGCLSDTAQTFGWLCRAALVAL